MMFGCYRKGDANDPDTYCAAVAAILAEYPPDVVKHVTDPRTGIPRRMKFMPNPAEVAEACEERAAWLKSVDRMKKLGLEWNGERWVKLQAAE